MADLETRLKAELDQEAAGATYSRSLPPDLARGVSRRRALRASALSTVTALAVVAVSVVAVTYTKDRNAVRVLADKPIVSKTAKVELLPASPLAARLGAASAWTGREFFVWGGSRGNQAASETFDDGATFDPGSGAWRLLPAVPISGRAGAVAVWTGSEVLLWGGSDDTPGVSTPSDGALFNPTTRSWRRIADAPSGRVFARAFALKGRVVVVGGTTPQGAPSSALLYDTATDRWTEVPSPVNVVDATATSNEVVLLAVDPASGGVSVAAIDPILGAVRNLPTLAVTGRVQRAGIAWTGDRLVAVVTANDLTHVASLEAGAAWRPAVSPAPDAFHPPVHVGFDPDTTPLAWTGNKLLSASELGVELFDVATGAVEIIRSGDSRTSCGAGAAEAWTGRVLLSWGGQSCRPNGSPEVATGVTVTP